MKAWTEDRMRDLKQLWLCGFSTQEIADLLEVGGRNIIAGKAHRMGLPRRLNPVVPGTRKRAQVSIPASFQPLFDQVVDRVIDTAGKIPVTECARRVGLHPEIAKLMWLGQVEAEHGTECSTGMFPE